MTDTDVRDTLRQFALAGVTQQEFEEALEWAKAQSSRESGKPAPPEPSDRIPGAGTDAVRELKE